MMAPEKDKTPLAAAPAETGLIANGSTALPISGAANNIARDKYLSDLPGLKYDMVDPILLM